MRLYPKTLLPAAFALLLIAAAPARAFDIPPAPPPVYEGLIVPLFHGTTPMKTSSDTAPASVAASTLATGTPQIAANAAQLAAAFPAEYRERMTSIYQQAFDTWRQLERKLQLQPDDAASAVAAFVAGNYMAYRNVEVPDEVYLKLVNQMRGTLAGNRGFSAASPAEKRTLYEQTAMVGTFMAVVRVALQQKPDARASANFRNAAAANLQVVLGVPAERVRITEQGLSIQ